MLKLDKDEQPDFFDAWKKGTKGCKEKLRAYILEKEQQQCCCYCEMPITADQEKSHIEHIRPRDKFPKLKDEYTNLSVSCQIKERCGHAKGNKFSDDFIVPTEEDPADYLTYSPDGKIVAVNDNSKGSYTIELLNLNAPKLIQVRRTLFIELNSMKDTVADFEKYFLEYPTFIRYFKQYYC